MAGTERNWAELDTPGAFDRCVRASIGELYAFTGLLCGHDRDAAERLVTGVYASLWRAVDEGLTDSVSLGALRSAVRRRWVEDRRIGLLAQVDEARRDTSPAATLGELRELERAVLVLHHVNRMPVDRIADELGVPISRVEQIESNARRRLHGDDEPERRWIRQHAGDTVLVRADLVDGLVGRTSFAAGHHDHHDDDGHHDHHDDHHDDEQPAAADDAGPPTAAMPVHESPAHEGTHADDVGSDDTDDPDHGDTPNHDGDDTHGPVGSVTDGADATGLPNDPSGDPDPTPVAQRGTRGARGRWMAVAVALVLIAGLVAALALWRGRDDAGDDATEPGTTLPAGTSAATTAAPATLDTTLDTTAPLFGGGAFAPSCAEREPVAAEVPAVDETVLDTFGPIDAVPNLVIDLPASQGAAGPADSTATALRVPGGVVVTVLPVEGSLISGSIVARVDVDGTVRWVRCFDRAALVVGGADAALADSAAISFGETWQELSLVDGTVGDEIEAPPLRASTTRGAPTPWPDPAVATLVGETFTAGASDGVTVVLGCLAPGADGTTCDEIVLRGYGTDSGTLLWQRDGVRDVEIVNGGYAVVLYAPDPASAGSWYMIDVGDGTAVDGQVWGDPATFSTDGTVASWVELFGGVVARGDAGSVSIWYPAAADIGTATVALV